MKRGCVSVIVLMYNAQRYIQECVDSIMRQNVDKEIILIDDGSTDQTGQICRELSQANPFVHYLL